jgi:hypothetical protein
MFDFDFVFNKILNILIADILAFDKTLLSYFTSSFLILIKFFFNFKNPSYFLLY